MRWATSAHCLLKTASDDVSSAAELPTCLGGKKLCSSVAAAVPLACRRIPPPWAWTRRFLFWVNSVVSTILTAFELQGNCLVSKRSRECSSEILIANLITSNQVCGYLAKALDIQTWSDFAMTTSHLPQISLALLQKRLAQQTAFISTENKCSLQPQYQQYDQERRAQSEVNPFFTASASKVNLPR